MGNMNAIGMAGAVQEGDVSLVTALEWHLQSNHFPPVSLEWLPICEKAITFANAGEWDATLLTPGLRPSMSVGEICDGLHLHAFIVNEDELLAEHAHGEHHDTARGECPACREIAEEV